MRNQLISINFDCEIQKQSQQYFGFVLAHIHITSKCVHAHRHYVCAVHTISTHNINTVCQKQQQQQQEQWPDQMCT